MPSLAKLGRPWRRSTAASGAGTIHRSRATGPASFPDKMRTGKQDRSVPRRPAATAPRGIHALTVAATVLALLTIAGGALVVLRLPRRSAAAVVDARAAGTPGESQGAPLRAPARASRAGAVGIPAHTTID